MNIGEISLDSDSIQSFMVLCDSRGDNNNMLDLGELVKGINTIINPMIQQVTNQILGRIISPPSPITEDGAIDFGRNNIWSYSLYNIPHCAVVFILASWFYSITLSIAQAQQLSQEKGLELFDGYIRQFNALGQGRAAPPVAGIPSIRSPYISSNAITVMMYQADDDDSQRLDPSELAGFLTNVLTQEESGSSQLLNQCARAAGLLKKPQWPPTTRIIREILLAGGLNPMGISIPQYVVLYIVGLYFMLLSNSYVEGHARGMAGRVTDIPEGSIGVYDSLVQEFNARFGGGADPVALAAPAPAPAPAPPPAPAPAPAPAPVPAPAPAPAQQLDLNDPCAIDGWSEATDVQLMSNESICRHILNNIQGGPMDMIHPAGGPPGKNGERFPGLNLDKKTLVIKYIDNVDRIERAQLYCFQMSAIAEMFASDNPRTDRQLAPNPDTLATMGGFPGAEIFAGGIVFPCYNANNSPYRRGRDESSRRPGDNMMMDRPLINMTKVINARGVNLPWYQFAGILSEQGWPNAPWYAICISGEVMESHDSIAQLHPRGSENGEGFVFGVSLLHCNSGEDRGMEKVIEVINPPNNIDEAIANCDNPPDDDQRQLRGRPGSPSGGGGRRKRKSRRQRKTLLKKDHKAKRTKSRRPKHIKSKRRIKRNHRQKTIKK